MALTGKGNTMADQILIANTSTQITLSPGNFLYVGTGIEVSYIGVNSVVDAHLEFGNDHQCWNYRRHLRAGTGW